ncbi:MAG TPA: type II toxin-antitoxin system VapB family antitoxin [Gemmatimonadota bacterium]|nr:type II toxin-antitoxin system VapB family antitoxin [Gemmatimonadota bacterium]
MKTTVEIADTLLTDARRVAQREGTTLRALVEEGLRRIVGERSERKEFELRKVTFPGEGVDPDLDGGSWEKIRRRIYEDPGE